MCLCLLHFFVGNLHLSFPWRKCQGDEMRIIDGNSIMLTMGFEDLRLDDLSS